MNNPQGAWIFLSHSSKDWNKVRGIRNFLEEKGHRPLVFFLKSISEDSELDGLIKREIEARTWFLLCDSQNARESQWVQDEVAIIKSLPGKYHETIDLEDTLETQLERIERLCRRATVFLSCANRDRPFARRMSDVLIKHDYNVLGIQELPAGGIVQEEISSAIDRAAERGFVLLLLSPFSVQSQWVECEIKYALTKRANIIPIIIDDAAEKPGTMRSMLSSVLSSFQFDFSKGDFDTNMDRLIADMKRLPME